MKPIGRQGLLIATLLVSGCFQEVAPRHEVAAVDAADSAGTQAIARESPEVPGEVAAATLPDLAKQLQESADPEVRRETLYLIADEGEVEDAALVGQALYDPDSKVRMAAVEALTGIGGESSADWMLVALGDPEPGVRRTAVEALGDIGGDTAEFLLRQALFDADAGVREAAEQMLAEQPIK
jgi:HEAT repeat protein